MTDPLRTISGFAELLVELDPTAEEAKEYAQHILDSSLRLSTMLQGLLAYARAGRAPGKGVPVDLGAAVGQVRNDVAAIIGDREARVEADVPDDAAVIVDASDLRMILQNLVSNAVKFGAAEAPLITVGAERRGDAWRVSVRDDGAGIAPEDQQRIFRAFERAPSGGDRAGYGLGLAICQRLVERHGGRIGVESASDAGTRFWFTFPAA